MYCARGVTTVSDSARSGALFVAVAGVTEGVVTAGVVTAAGGAALGVGCAVCGADWVVGWAVDDRAALSAAATAAVLSLRVAAARRDDGNSNGVTTMTSAINTSAVIVRLSMQAGDLANSLGDRVVSARTERMAARDAARRQPTTAERSMFLERFDGVRGTTRIITARGGKQRRQRDLIPTHEQHEDGTHQHWSPVSLVSVAFGAATGS